MHILLRRGGGGCHGDMLTKPMSRSKAKGQRSGHLIRRSSGAQSPDVDAGVMGLPECIGR